MANFGRYLNFIYQFNSGYFLSEESNSIETSFYFTSLTPIFIGSDDSYDLMKRSTDSVLLELYELHQSKFLGLDLSKASLNDRIRSFLQSWSDLRLNPTANTNDENQKFGHFHFKFLINPNLDPPRNPKEEFYFRLIQNICSIIVTEVYWEFSVRDRLGKENLASLIFRHLEYEIENSFKRKLKVEYRVEHQDFFSQKRAHDFIYGLFCISLSWIYCKIKDLFSDELSVECLDIKAIQTKYPFDRSRFSLQVKRSAIQQPEVEKILSNNSVEVKTFAETTDIKGTSKKSFPRNTFLFRRIKGNETILLNIIKELINKHYFLEESRTSAEDFFNVLLSKELAVINYQVYIGCGTGEFAYIMDSMASLFFKNLKASVIGSSKLFITQREGIVLTADNYTKGLRAKHTPEFLASIKEIVCLPK